VGDTVTFASSTVKDPEGAAVTRAWDLDGDGNFTDGTGVSETRRFTSAGTFVVRLRASDPSGATATFAKAIVVTRTGGDGASSGGGGGVTLPPVIGAGKPKVVGLKVVRRGGVSFATFRLPKVTRIAVKLERRRVAAAGYAKVRSLRAKVFKAGKRQIRLGALTAGKYRVRLTLRSGGRSAVVTKVFTIR
jgi:PKD repeat protein